MSSSLPRLVLTGPESTGKSTLAKVLCDRLQAKLVDEYLRDYFDLHGKIGLEDAIAIAQGQWDREETIAAEAKRSACPIICDTDLISSIVYSKHYYADQLGSDLWVQWQAWVDRHSRLLRTTPWSPRLYILCGSDWPWEPDGQRDAPHLRSHFSDLFKQQLLQHELNHIEVSGSLDERLTQILSRFSGL